VVVCRSGLAAVVDDQAAHIILQRTLLLIAVVAWSGVLVSDVLPSHAQAADALPWAEDAVAMLLDAQPDWEKELGAALMQRLADRKTKKDTAAKNS
jgi:hypothetical protein